MKTEEYILVIMLAIAFVIMGVQLIRGKWLMLIAGYNTAGKEGRAKLNGKNLGKLIGSLLLWCALLMLIQVFLPVNPNLFIVGTLIPGFFVLVFANTSRLFKNK